MSPAGGMRWASAHSTLADHGYAIEEIAASLSAGLGEGAVDLLLLFIGASHLRNAEPMAATLRGRLAPRCLMGAAAQGVVSRDHEVETGPAVSAIAASLPGVELAPFILTQDHWRDALGDSAAFDA